MTRTQKRVVSVATLLCFIFSMYHMLWRGDVCMGFCFLCVGWNGVATLATARYAEDWFAKNRKEQE